MNLPRREFLKSTLIGSTALLGTGFGLPTLLQAQAEKKPEDVMAEALKKAFGKEVSVESSDQIDITAPEIAENGATVPITVETQLENVESIALIAPNNPAPFIAKFDFPQGAKGFIQTRIKMGKTGEVVSVVKAGGKFYKAGREVKVTIGGCGG